MFGKKPELKQGSYIFSVKQNGDFNDFIFAAVTGIDGKKVGVTGVIVNPVGLKNKLEQGKTGERSREILENPTPDNVVLALVYRVEHENYSGILNLDSDKCDLIPPKVFGMLDGWIRESLPEFINNVLSLPVGADRDEAKHILKNRMETLTDPHLKRTLYSICRSLKILN
jgi:hypothetical protein